MKRFALAALVLAPALAQAATDPNKWPHAVRQTYDDGTWTEVAIVQCDENDCDYVFRVGDKTENVASYPFSLRGQPYSLHMRGGYGYGPLADGAYSLSVPVGCDKADNAFAGVAEGVTLVCRATFKGAAGKLTLEGIDIFGAGDTAQRRPLAVPPPPRSE